MPNHLTKMMNNLRISSFSLIPFDKAYEKANNNSSDDKAFS